MKLLFLAKCAAVAVVFVAGAQLGCVDAGRSVGALKAPVSRTTNASLIKRTPAHPIYFKAKPFTPFLVPYVITK
jgi:hypothetical protein